MEWTVNGSGRHLLISVGDVLPPVDGITAVSVTGMDWNESLSPWPADKVFAKGEAFAGKADEFLRELTDVLESEYSGQWESRGIIGYSLAGLFALYACTKTDLFDRCASVSGSLWYPGFTEYLRSHPVHCPRVYLSLGDREAAGKNPVMRTVEERTKEAYSLISSYADAVLEMNPGNHFNEPGKRIQKAIDWLYRDGEL